MKPTKEAGESYLICSRCGYKVKASSSSSLRVSSRIEHSTKEKTIIIEDQQELAKLPITREVTCKRCGHHEAYYWVLQTRAADEPPTRFYKCVKCGFVWREYE
mgnify:CR=1 FL=1